MSHESISQLAKLYPNCFCEPRRPLKIGIREDIAARHPDLRPGLIASALRTYTRSVGYWSALRAGTPRIDLDGNIAGEVTIEDEQDAQRKIAKAVRRAAAREIEDRKKDAGQFGTKPATRSSPAPVAGPPRLGLAGLKAAAAARRAQLVAAEAPGEKKPKIMIVESIITCPHCATAKLRTMPMDACQFFYVCTGCGTPLRPKEGDCCVFCSYGSVPCPPMQVARAAGCCAR